MKQEANHRLHSTTFGKGNWFLIKFLNFKNVKMKAYVAMIAENLKALCSEPAPKF